MCSKKTSIICSWNTSMQPCRDFLSMTAFIYWQCDINPKQYHTFGAFKSNGDLSTEIIDWRVWDKGLVKGNKYYYCFDAQEFDQQSKIQILNNAAPFSGNAPLPVCSPLTKANPLHHWKVGWVSLWPPFSQSVVNPKYPRLGRPDLKAKASVPINRVLFPLHFLYTVFSNVKIPQGITATA